jgi:hypothetical protein
MSDPNFLDTLDSLASRGPSGDKIAQSIADTLLDLEQKAISSENATRDYEAQKAALQSDPMTVPAARVPAMTANAVPPAQALGLTGVPRRPAPSPEQIKAIMAQLQGMRNAPVQAAPLTQPASDPERDQRVMDEVYRAFGLGKK